MRIEIDLWNIDSWAAFHDYFQREYGFVNQEKTLPQWMRELKRFTSEETLFVIKNPMLVYGDSSNAFRDTILQMITVVNSERYADGQPPTIKVVFE